MKTNIQVNKWSIYNLGRIYKESGQLDIYSQKLRKKI